MSYVVSIIGMALVILMATLECCYGRAMTYIYHPPESVLDTRYSYQWEILRTALEKTRKKYGRYLLQQSEMMTEPRQVHELRMATGKLTVMYLDSNPEYERDLLPVRIPVDRNLVGYRIFLIRKENQPVFSAVTSIKDLRCYSCGMQINWIDGLIYTANGLKVVHGSSYDGLFEMLINRRFDYFSRGANEIVAEFEKRKEKMPDLHIEETLVVAFPLPMYFWFSRTAEGERLAHRVREGMTKMIEDGTYDRIFNKHYGAVISRLKLDRRKIFRIHNPYLTPETPLHDKRLWFEPKGS